MSPRSRLGLWIACISVPLALLAVSLSLRLRSGPPKPRTAAGNLPPAVLADIETVLVAMRNGDRAAAAAALFRLNEQHPGEPVFYLWLGTVLATAERLKTK